MARLFMRSRRVLLDVYDEFKYTASKEAIENSKEIELNNCTGFDVVSGKEAEEIEKYTDDSCIDDLHEYLILFFEDGTEGTFRNSYVDLFVL